MKIPKRFKLFGRTIEVVWDQGPFIERPECAAFACYRQNRIEMNPNTAVSGTVEQQEQNFLHELVHFITYHSGAAYRGDDARLMHQDEEFVDLTSQLLHQAMSTMEY